MTKLIEQRQAGEILDLNKYPEMLYRMLYGKTGPLLNANEESPT